MKKLSAIFLTLFMAFTMTGCSSSANREESRRESGGSESVPQSADSSQERTQSSSTQKQNEENTGSKILVAYFSWADNAILADDVDAVTSPSVLPPGNVVQLAHWVREESGGDIFSIRVTDPYPSDWSECLSRANRERGDNARPKLVENVSQLDQYDTVFLGYPN